MVALLLLYLVTQLASSWVSAVNIQDKTQRRLLFLFPIFFSFIIIRFPAGLIVYWITTNVWTIGQQLFIRRFLPAPEPHPATAGAGRAPQGDLKPARAGRAAAVSEGSAKPARGARAAAGDGASGKGSSDGGNGGPRKAPPPSPRKKKKRSGRRR